MRPSRYDPTNLKGTTVSEPVKLSLCRVCGSVHTLTPHCLEALIGEPPEGSHPDEWKPRAATWHQERSNWAAEVERLTQAKNESRWPPEGCSLMAVHTGDGWSLEVSYPEGHPKYGEDCIAMLAWPESWPESVDGEFLRRAGFEVV